AGKRYVADADRSLWAYHHAKNVDLIMSLSEARYGRLDRLIDSLKSREAALQVALVTNPRPGHIDRLKPWIKGIPAQTISRLVAGQTPVRAARLIIGELLNPNLRGIRLAYDPSTGSPTFQFRALIDSIYWQLSQRMGSVHIGKCPCGALFFADHGKQRFCPPPPGV